MASMTLRYTEADVAAKMLEVEKEVAKEAEELLDSMKAAPVPLMKRIGAFSFDCASSK